MPNVSTVVIGAGHCGLAMSRCLTDRSIDHVVLERGEVAQSWRTRWWDSLRLLTPNWMSRLPGGYAYQGDDPDGYLAAREVADLIAGYASQCGAPVQVGTTVTAVQHDDGGYLIQTDQGTWRARSVVLASGACSMQVLPPFVDQLPPGITSLTPDQYRSPQALPEGGVLVVGASATGIQIADEVHRSGRPVTIASGEHVRLPRTYRGRDILWWMDTSGLLDEDYTEIDDVRRARSLPSMQLVGSPGRTIDLNALQALGVRLIGRLAGIRDGIAQFSGSLPNVCALADLKMVRLLDAIDIWAASADLDETPAERFAPTLVPAPVPLSIDLRKGEIRTIIWATGFQPDMSWLDLPVFDRKQRLIHDGGVVTPGLYVLGLPFLRRRKSSLIDGAAADAAALAAHLAGHLDGVTARSSA